MDTYILVAAGAVAAGFVQGLSGFAFGLVAMSFWVWVLAPEVAGPLVVGCSLLGQAMSIGGVWRRFEAGRALPFIVGGVVGVPLGAWLLPHVPPAVFKVALGGLMVVWCPVMLCAGDLPKLAFGGRGADAVAGWIGGVMGGLGGFSGPVPTVWCVLRGWDKDSQRAMFQPFHLTMHTLTLGAYVAGGLVTPGVVGMFGFAAVLMVVPAMAGARLYRRFSDAGFRRLILLLLLGSGVALLVNALPRL